MTKSELLDLIEKQHDYTQIDYVEFEAVLESKDSYQQRPLRFGSTLIECYGLSKAQVMQLAPTSFDNQFLKYLEQLDQKHCGINIIINNGQLTAKELCWEDLTNRTSLKVRMQTRAKDYFMTEVNTYSKQSFGTELSELVADELQYKSYCLSNGMGRACDGFYYNSKTDRYFYCTFYEGEFRSSLREFHGKKAFVEWLSQESDFSICSWAVANHNSLSLVTFKDLKKFVHF